MMLKGQDEDGDVPAVEKNDEIEEEAANTSTENETQVGKDAEIQEVTGEEEQLAGSSSTAAQAEETTVTEKEASAEDGMENRSVTMTFYQLFRVSLILTSHMKCLKFYLLKG